MNFNSVAIIGGGACGVSVFIELFLQLRIAGLHRMVGIVIIEENEEVGKGLAFGTTEPGHILNTQADLMGIHVTEPAHFSKWLIQNDHEVGHEVVDNQGRDEAYTTRRLYGDYLREQFDHYFALARQEGMHVRVLHGSATNILYQNGGSFHVEVDGQEPVFSDYVILAPGTPIANNYPELEGNPHYFSSPWPSQPILDRIPRDADVAILGSSLSAIDALMTLTDHGFSGKFRCYALDGLLPRVQADKPEMAERRFLTLEKLHEIQRTRLRNPTVKELFRLFMEDAEAYAGRKIDWKATARQGKSAGEMLDEDIRIARNGGDALINIPYSLRYDSSQMWKWLDPAEKLKFKKWLGRFWAINRHCMPLYNARRVSDLFHQGRLEIISELTEVDFEKGPNHFVMRYGKDEEAVEQFLINATGPASQVSEMRSVLLHNLAETKLISPHAVGGICINTDTMQILSDRDVPRRLYAVGHVVNGELLDVNAVWFNVKMIGNLCRHLTDQLIGKAS